MRAMKSFLMGVVMMVSCLPAPAQSDEVQQLILNYEKLAQLKSILQNMKKGYNILNQGYSTVKDLSNGNFRLHDAFLNGLLQVSPAVKNYKRVADIIRCQAMIVSEYKTAFNRFKSDKNLLSSELQYISKVYNNLFNRSVENLDELVMVFTASNLRMSDAERLEAIDRIFYDTEGKLSFLRSFNRKTMQLASARARLENDNKHTKVQYGLTKQ